MLVRVPILLYHDLDSRDLPSVKTNSASLDTVVREAEFVRQLQWLSDNGYRSLSLAEFFKSRTERTLIPPKRVIVTFDDGDQSNYHLAFRHLQKFGFSAVFFLIAERLNQPHYLTTKQTREMQNAGMEMGSHGFTHSYLPLMDKKGAEAELLNSKAYLEMETGRPVEFLAYPGGHFTRQITRLAEASGYTGACSCLQGYNDIHTEPFLLRRLEVRRRCMLSSFRNLFNPRYIAFYRFVDFGKKSVCSIMGLEKYRELRSRLYRFYPFKR